MKTVISGLQVYKGEFRNVTVICELTEGIGVALVGLPDSQIKMTMLRVNTALETVGYHIPMKKVVIKVLGAFNVDEKADDDTCEAIDLAIAVAILTAAGKIDSNKLCPTDIFVGKLTPAGRVKEPEHGSMVRGQLADMINYREWLYNDERTVFGWTADVEYKASWKGCAILSDVVFEIMRR